MLLPIILVLTTGLIITIAVIFYLLARSRQVLLRDVNAAIGQLETIIRQEYAANRVEGSSLFKHHFDIVASRLTETSDHQARLLNHFQQQGHALAEQNDRRIQVLNETTLRALGESRLELQKALELMRQDNTDQLEKMRLTVDEKLHKTLETRLGQSFKIVSDSLEKVQKGLGEMQTLAHGVGDLKRVLSNVKTRGILGEIQLGNILEQILTPDQYALNVATIPNSRNHVEFAIRFPGKKADTEIIWLPIDSKFPMDRYESVLKAYDHGDTVGIQLASKQLVATVRTMAKDIRTKYIAPPHTTEFGVLFLPVEGLYAEVVRQPGLVEEMQRTYKIMLAGPTNLAAFLNSLQMGFQSLAIEKRSSEVWKILGAVKTEFSQFGDVLAKTQRKLQEASSVIDKAGVRTRAIERKLRNVDEYPAIATTAKTPKTLPEPIV